MKHTGGIFSDSKTMMCSDHITIVGFNYLYQERKPTLDIIEKILKWKACKNIVNVRVFLECCNNY